MYFKLDSYETNLVLRHIIVTKKESCLYIENKFEIHFSYVFVV